MSSPEPPLVHGRSPSEYRRLANALQEMPNVDAALADDLLRLGIAGQDDLIGRTSDELYDALCHLDGTPPDPSRRDVFTAVIAYAHGGPPTPWYDFTPARKRREAANRQPASST